MITGISCGVLTPHQRNPEVLEFKEKVMDDQNGISVPVHISERPDNEGFCSVQEKKSSKKETIPKLGVRPPRVGNQHDFAPFLDTSI